MSRITPKKRVKTAESPVGKQVDPKVGWHSRLRPWVLVALVVLFVAIVRIRLLETPLERDEGEYAYAAQLMLQGIPPYQLAFSMKFPGTYGAYAAIMAIFGQTIAGIHLGFLRIAQFGKERIEQFESFFHGHRHPQGQSADMYFGGEIKVMTR